MPNPEDIGTLPAEQPVLTGKEKFRRGGFKPAAEVIAEAEAAAAAPAAPAEGMPPDDQALVAAALAADPNVIVELPGGEATPPEPEEAAPAEEPKFRIGGREFATQEEAWAYAEQIERERAESDAFRQGVEAAARLAPQVTSPAAPAEPPKPAEIDPEYYTNPQAYFAKREAQLIEKAAQTVDQRTAAKKSQEDLWTNFYKDYPDLVGAQRIVAGVYQENFSRLQHVEVTQALKEIATKARAELKPILDARLPKQPLPAVRTAASPGGAREVTPPAAPKQALNFAAQMKKLKASRKPLL